MADVRAMVRGYVAQQIELGMPDPVFSSAFAAAFLSSKPAPASRKPAVSGPRPDDSARGSRPARLPAPKSGAPAAVKPRPLIDLGRFAVPDAEKTMDRSEAKREALKKIYYEFKLCHRCPLGKRRNHFVFGSGNVDAPLLVVGEAPGADEDEQGLPFVGRAGKLLTDMLSAIQIDRQRSAFITNVLKCRPPENRTPEIEEIAACLPLLKQQIEIMRPKAILLLGRIAAHALLERTDSIQTLREQTHAYASIPAVVTYHPAALLRTQEFKRPAWEDLKKLQKILTELGAYGA